MALFLENAQGNCLLGTFLYVPLDIFPPENSFWWWISLFSPNLGFIVEHFLFILNCALFWLNWHPSMFFFDADWACKFVSRVEIPLKNRSRFQRFERFSSKIWAVWEDRHTDCTDKAHLSWRDFSCNTADFSVSPGLAPSYGDLAYQTLLIVL